MPTDNGAIELEAHRLLDIGAEVQRRLAPFLQEFLVTSPEIEYKCYAVKHRLKSIDRIMAKYQSRIVVDSTYQVSDMPDICAFRVVTMYQDQIAIVVRGLMDLFIGSLPNSTGLDFVVDAPVRIDINTSKPEADPSSIVRAVRSAADLSGVPVQLEVKQRPTGYSSVHLVVKVLNPVVLTNNSTSIQIEIQIRSALEDVWGDIDYRLRYGQERGQPGISWMRHLNVLKSLIDGIIGYVDLIKRQSDEEVIELDRIRSPIRSINTGQDQLERFRYLPDFLRIRLESAFGLWSKAQERGAHPGLFRQAADEFLNILQDLRGSEADPNLKPLIAALKAERAYMLMQTGDVDDRADAENLYKDLLKINPEDATSNYRLSSILREKSDYQGALNYLNRSLKSVESGSDIVVGVNHWAYDDIRLGFGLTFWRMAEDKLPSVERRRALLASAINHAHSVISKPADIEHSRLSAINDLLYYNWELEKLGGYCSILEERDISNLKLELYGYYQRVKLDHPNDLVYNWLDTLARVFRNDCEVVRMIASDLEIVIETRVKHIRPDLELGERGSYRWTAQLVKHLNEDEADALVFCQEILEEFGRPNVGALPNSTPS